MSKKKRKGNKMGEDSKMDPKEDTVQEEIVAETMDDEDLAEPEAAPEEVAPSTDDELAKLEEQNKVLANEVIELRERLMRNAADTDNYKKRLQREKEDAVRYANTSLVKDLIGPLDDFSRALDAASQGGDFKALEEGVRMIEDKLYTTLKTNWGLEVIDAVDVPFDPDQHEACLMEEVDGLDVDTVTMILQKGYKLNGRVIRPAKVRVAKGRS